MDEFFKRQPVNRTFEPVRVASINPDVDVSATAETIWATGGAYTYRTTAAVIAFSSSSASDTAVTALVVGLDSTYALVSETVALNGTTTVNTVNSYLRVHSVELSAVAVGAVSGGTIVTIAAGATYWDAAIYTVPLGHSAYLVAVNASTTLAMDAEIFLRTREVGKPFKNVFTRVVTASAPLDYTFAAPIYLPAKTDIDMQAVNASTANTRVHAGFEIWLSKD